MFQFDLPKDQSSIIKVIGVGGGGSNAVNHMYGLGIKGVDFLVCNTDSQALDISPVPVKIQLGASLTEGRGAGSIPDVGKNAAIENLDDIKQILETNTKMVFVTAGMGGGTGTGAAPVIAKAAREMGILTVGIVTVPFIFEGRKRRMQAEEGIEKMREAVDTLLVINNDKLRELYGNLSLGNAFIKADDVLATAAKGIAEVISVTGQINVDFNDVNTVMKDSGVAIMGSAVAEGENRATKAVEEALASPLLNDNNIIGAQYVLLNITYGEQEVLMDEIADITDYIQEEAGSSADVIWGHGHDEEIGNGLCVTIIATGFKASPETGLTPKEPEKKKMNLETENRSTVVTQPVSNPVHQRAELLHENHVSEDVPEPFVVKLEEPEEVADSNNTSAHLDVVDSKQSAEGLNNSTANDDSEVLGSENKNSHFEEQTRIEFDKPINDVEQHVSSSAGEQAIKDSFSESDRQSNLAGDGKIRYQLEDDIIQSDSMTLKDSEALHQPYTNQTSQAVPNSVEGQYGGTMGANNFSQPTHSQKPSLWGGQETNAAPTNQTSTQPSPEELQHRASERIARIKELSAKLKTPAGIAELENEPAYKRRNVNLEEPKHSSESSLSRYSIGEVEGLSGEKRTGLSGNSFLHDNVD